MILCQRWFHSCNEWAASFLYCSMSEALQASVNINLPFTLLRTWCQMPHVTEISTFNRLADTLWNLMVTSGSYLCVEEVESVEQTNKGGSALLLPCNGAMVHWMWESYHQTVFRKLPFQKSYKVSVICLEMCLRNLDPMYERSEYNAWSFIWDLELPWNRHHSLWKSTGYKPLVWKQNTCVILQALKCSVTFRDDMAPAHGWEKTRQNNKLALEGLHHDHECLKKSTQQVPNYCPISFPSLPYVQNCRHKFPSQKFGRLIAQLPDSIIFFWHSSVRAQRFISPLRPAFAIRAGA